jgi:hypothetical protein
MSHSPQCSRAPQPTVSWRCSTGRKCAGRHALAVVPSPRVKATSGQGPRRCPEGSDSACAHSGRRQPCARRGADYAPFFVHHRIHVATISRLGGSVVPRELPHISPNTMRGLRNASALISHPRAPAPAATRGVPQGNIIRGGLAGVRANYLGGFRKCH